MESAGFACYSDASSTWRKSAEDGEGVRGKLIFAVSSLTRLLGDEQLQKKGEVFSHLRHITDLCNSLPEETGEPLQLKDSSSGVSNPSSQKQNALQGYCDKTLATCDVDSEDNQEKRSLGVYDFTPKSKKQNEKQRKENLGRVPSMACDVSTY